MKELKIKVLGKTNGSFADKPMRRLLNKFKMTYEQEISSENILLKSRIKFKFA